MARVCWGHHHSMIHTIPTPLGGVLVNGSVAMAGDRVIIRACHGGFLDFLTMYSALTMAKQFYF